MPPLADPLLGQSSLTTKEKPRHLWPDYASQFNDVEIAAAYKHRPPYPEEAATIVVDLLRGQGDRVLELGAGSGDFAALISAHVAHITAVEPSDAMRKLGTRRTFSTNAEVDWIANTAEGFTPQAEYSAVVAAESLHWMDWETVLPALAQRLHHPGLLIMVDRGLAGGPPWDSDLQQLIAEFSTNRHYQPFDLLGELEGRGLISSVGQRETAVVMYQQSVTAYVESFHSRNGFSRARMSSVASAAFDEALEALVIPHSTNGLLTLPTVAKVSWGNVTIQNGSSALRARDRPRR